MSPEELEDFEGGLGEDYDPEDSESLAFDMYGAKVLYRPDSYDYDAGSGGSAENPTHYYGKYAWYILNDLYGIYGIPNIKSEESPYYTRLDFNDANLPYLYDSIRYQVDTVGEVSKTRTQNDDGSWSEAVTLGETYVIVGADYTNGWNWSFNYDWVTLESLMQQAFQYKQDGSLYTKINNSEVFQVMIESIYDSVYDALYKQIYLGAPDQNSYNQNSDFVKALEYAIYRYALDLEPAEVIVTKNASGEQPYSVSIGSQTVDEALASVKELFEKVGSYVGLTPRQMSKLKTWVRDNVIGYKAKDDFNYYSEVIELVHNDDTITYEFVTKDDSKSGNLGRNYDEAVNNIIDGVCQNVQIGSADEDGSGTIDDNFLASEIMEYAGNTFLIAGDENFPSVAEGGENKYYIKPLEYQSVVLMLKDETPIDGMYIALKYDADGDGTEEGVWNEEKYLDIIVEMNYYSNADNKLYTIASQQTRVYDGPFDPYHENPPDMYEDAGNVYFYDWAACGDEGILKHLDKEERLIAGEFKTDIGDGVLMTDVGKVGGYALPPIISNNPLILVGTSEARRYYQLLEPGEDEDLDGKTYVTGRLNPKKFAGSDGCDYVEITYKVLKNHQSDTSKNYKFYTGISFIY
ncbi:MAG: hypothetical protein J6A28_03510 [Clostridia bacterium]|nr:hypothetical protein [Clostridia bacterium]